MMCSRLRSLVKRGIIALRVWHVLGVGAAQNVIDALHLWDD
jgi:hypothetical protein